MTASKQQIDADFDSFLNQWTTCRTNTTELLGRLKEYYRDVENKSKAEVIEKAAEDREEVNKYLEEHENISADAKNAARYLSCQVEASENGVVKMKKHGLKAAIGFTILGVIIGVALGLKVPGFGQPVAVAVAAVLGGVCFGCFAFTAYCVMNSRAHKRKNLWIRANEDNESGLALAQAIPPKRLCLSEIRNKLDDIGIDNYQSTIKGLLAQIDEYIDD